MPLAVEILKAECCVNTSLETSHDCTKFVAESRNYHHHAPTPHGLQKAQFGLEGLSAISFGQYSPVQEHACTKIATHYKSKPTYFLKHMSHRTVMVNLDSLTKYLNNLVDYSRINKAPRD